MSNMKKWAIAKNIVTTPCTTKYSGNYAYMLATITKKFKTQAEARMYKRDHQLKNHRVVDTINQRVSR